MYVMDPAIRNQEPSSFPGDAGLRPAIAVVRGGCRLILEGLHVEKVVHRPERLAPVPGAPSWVAGVGCVEGQLFTVIDPAPGGVERTGGGGEIVLARGGTFLFGIVGDRVEPSRGAAVPVDGDEPPDLPEGLARCAPAAADPDGHPVVSLDLPALARERPSW